MHRWVALGAALGSMLLWATAASAATTPFERACVPQAGVRYCPGGLDRLQPSFDGTPLDVDVTLPATADGPFPTLVMLHGWGGSKRAFQTPSTGGSSNDTAYTNVFFARQGWAVVNPSARGFGQSCGNAVRATVPGCERGWLHLGDQRYEIRDVQHLLGVLVDQEVADPEALASTGVSYGGGQTLSLAYLKDRVRLPDGGFAQWRSPGGRPLALAAGWARWPWSDLGTSLLRNGRFTQDEVGGAALSSSPVGIPISSYINALYAIRGYTAPLGADPTADLQRWRDVADNDPLSPFASAIVRELTKYHSAAGLMRSQPDPPPLLVQSGWTDDLFPAAQALRVYNDVRRKDEGGDVALQLGDIGHPRATNQANAGEYFNLKGAQFLENRVRGTGRAPAAGSVSSFLQSCPATMPAQGPYVARDYGRLAGASVTLSGPGGRTVTWTGGDPAVASAFNPLGGGSCKTIPEPAAAPRTAVYRGSVQEDFTMIGIPTISARIRAKGQAGELIANLWDVDEEGNQTLVTRGAYRLTADQEGRIVFDLDGNAWRWVAGHTLKLELAGRDAPRLLAPPVRFKVKLSDLSLTVPTRASGGVLAAGR